MDKIITRFAPSPTGYLHIGGVRTALFNYLLTKKMGGKFILRIEDTDTARSTQEMTDAILDGMMWMGFDLDDGPFFQSERYDIYNDWIEKLIANGQAYYCEHTASELELMREQAIKLGKKNLYDNSCRTKGLQRAEGRAVRFKTPLEGRTVFKDLVKGSIAVENEEIDDFVIRRADGTPTYHLAVVVDDILMEISHVIRGDDHVSNTPKQILLYQAFNVNVPQFGHIPMILGSDKKKLSKRHGAVSVLAYKDMGYLPEALTNYLVRLGWSHGDDEIFSKAEMINNFSMEGVGKSPSVFDFDKLDWVNAYYIKECETDRLVKLLLPHFAKRGLEIKDEEYLKSMLPLFKARVKTLEDMAEQMMFMFCSDDNVSYAENAGKIISPEAKTYLQDLKVLFAECDFSLESLESIFHTYMEEKSLNFKKLGPPLRIAISGRTASPGLFETIIILGKERVLNRIEAVINYK